MLSHRIIGACAVLLAVPIGSAAAQEQPSAGKPLQLLQFARHEAKHQAKAPLHPHAALAEKSAKLAELKPHVAKKTVAAHHKMFAAVHRHRLAEAAAAPAPAAAQSAPAAPQPPVWPAADAAAPGSIAVPVPPAAPQNVKTEPVVSDAPDATVTDGQVAQVSPPPEANAPAAAADAHPAAAEPPPAKTAAAEPAVRAMVVAPAPADRNAIGSAPWLLQVLAALGGALAAGIVAWFLILRGRSEPREEEFFADSLAPGE
jgi:hypothetical protein